MRPMTDRLRRNDIVEIDIIDLANTGRSVGRHDGLVVMSDRGVPQDRIECQVTEVKRHFALARQLRLISPSPLRVEARCPHFDICGGCSWQYIPYLEQLRYKARFVSDAMERIGKLADVVIEPIISSQDEFYYRNKMEYSFSDEGQGGVAGLHVRGRFDEVFELEECFLQSPQSVLVLETIRSLAKEIGIPFYSFREGTGELRFLVVREGKYTGDLMVNVVTFRRDFDRRDELFNEIIKRVDGLTSLFHTVNGKKAHIAIGDEMVLVHGELYLTEKIGHLVFRVTPFSFLQTNSRQTQVLYEVIRDHARPRGDQTFLDLFCGCGTISLYLAGMVASVLGIEINPEAIEMAKLNASFNDIANAEFVSGDVRKLLVQLHDSGRNFDTIITDPPRAGLEQTAVRRICRLHARRIIAVSCNPATLARDLAQFVESGYRIDRVTPVDMFPQTPHVETVASLVLDESGTNLTNHS
jgi:23S rRNA (uracil1939-C5)-methyltransferase